jgi:hypothetical protein
MHHITEEMLREAYYALKRDAAAGVDLNGVGPRDHIGIIKLLPQKRWFLGAISLFLMPKLKVMCNVGYAMCDKTVYGRSDRQLMSVARPLLII